MKRDLAQGGDVREPGAPATLPFRPFVPSGRFEGRGLEEVPPWLLRHFAESDDSPRWLRRAARDALERAGPARPPDSWEDELRRCWREALSQVKDAERVGSLIRPALELLEGAARAAGGDVGAALPSWWAAVAMEYHPDRGGDTLAMQALNCVHGQLKRWLAEGA